VKAAKLRPVPRAVEKAAVSRRPDKYVLRLYVAGASEKSRRAILRVRQLCDGELKDYCELEVIDVYQQPILARDGQIVATPTLVKEPTAGAPVHRRPGKQRQLVRRVGPDTKGKIAMSQRASRRARPARRGKRPSRHSHG
jgi:circadian clock protein KaiB